jgi:hypothetical protein
MRRELIILLCLLTLALAFSSSCNLDSGEDPAAELARQAQQSAPPPAADTTKPAEGAAADTATTPEGEAKAPAGEAKAPAGEAKTPPAAQGGAAKPGAGDAAAPPAAGDAKPEDTPAAKPEEKAQPADGSKKMVPPGEAGEAEAAAGEGEGKEAEQAATTPEEKIENFKNLDPREIIDKKYTDLDSKMTHPQDPESPDFIPETGRVDPLTRVDSAVPDELKPPRAGETDQNQINNYLVAQAASAAVAGIALSIQCNNVIQIGLEKYASFSVAGGQQFTLQEGQGSGDFLVSMTEGIAIVGSITCASISTDQVVLTISASGYGTTTSISKNQVYIPRGFRGN